MVTKMLLVVGATSSDDFLFFAMVNSILAKHLSLKICKQYYDYKSRNTEVLTFIRTPKKLS